MSDNEDLLGDDLGDHSLADYNLGNEEEEQLLADDYETNSSQNVPTSVGSSYGNGDLVSADYSTHSLEYSAPQSMPYRVAEAECVVPNITVEVPNVPLPDHSTYAPYEPENAVVPPAMPAAPLESPQIVPSDMPSTPNGDANLSRERFRSERAPSSQRLPQVRDIPDSLDKVLIPRGGGAWAGRGRTSWRNQQQRGHAHPYRRHHRGNFNQRHSFPPQQLRPSPPQMRPEIRPNMRPDIRPDFRPGFRLEIHPDIRQDIRPDIRPDVHPDMRPDIRPEMRPDVRPEMRPEIRHEMRPDILPNMCPDVHPDTRPDIRPDMRPETRPDMRPDMHHEQMPPQMGPEISPERPILSEMQFRQENRFGPNAMRPNFRPNLDERAFGPRPMYQFPRPGFNPRPFGPPIREIAPNNVSHLPQVTIRQPLPGLPLPKMEKYGQAKPREQEVIMLPVQLPPNLPPGGLAGKKVLINPHFKGNFTPPVDGLPTYIPTRIQKSPPPSPTLESKFGPATDIDDAAERFIAEQRTALARAATRKARRSPQRYIENTTIEIENDMVGARDRDLLRRQEEFINANRAGLRRRMRSPSPPRRSPSPRRSPERRPRADAPRPHDESSQDSEYRRRVREQESLRERVLRAKEVRRRKNAVALQKQLDDRERERQDNTKEQPKLEEKDKPTSTQDRPDTTRRSPDKPTPRAVVKDKMDKLLKMDKVKELKVEPVRERSPVKEEKVEVNSTCDNLTPPRAPVGGAGGVGPGGGTPPLPDSDDDLDLILGDIDGILSDDDDLAKQDRTEAKAEPARAPTDLRSKLPPKADARRAPRQKIVFTKDRPDREKTPPRRAVVTSSTKTENTENDKKHAKAKSKVDANTNQSRQRITFDYKEQGKEDDKKAPFANRRVILQRKLSQVKDKTVFSRMDKADPTQPSAGIFSRAVRTAISDTRILVKKQDEPRVDYDSESGDEPSPERGGLAARVCGLPPAITTARLASLAGPDLQVTARPPPGDEPAAATMLRISLSLDKEDRSAKITFKSAAAAEQFKRKFNNKMVAASRLTVSLH